MEQVTNAVRLFRTTREWMAPVLTQSAFNDRGVMTPEEFVRAGDHLIACCPSWQWCEGEETKLRDYLPKRKQFLATRGVPSYQRVSSLSGATINNELIDGDIEGGWESPMILNPQVNQENNRNNDKLDGAVDNKKQDQDEYFDLEDENLVLDDTVQNIHSTSKTEISVLHSRRYDISITYDKYYQTPRIWLFGYDENGSPLSPDEVFEDVMQDYAKRTVTIDPHPHMSKMHASIHPCQHGSAMKNILENLKDNGQEPNVDQYLFIFLKFIQGVIPTIEYDYTVDVQVIKSSTSLT
jgi:ubiquitin-like-conjugating enzyme ATG3